MCYKLIKGTCEGLLYLHEDCGDRPIVHLNINPSNILLDEHNEPRITGFDFSKLIGEKNTKSVVLKLNGPMYVFSQSYRFQISSLICSRYVSMFRSFLKKMSMFCCQSV